MVIVRSLVALAAAAQGAAGANLSHVGLDVLDCGTGSYSPDGVPSTPCEACPAGTFSQSPGAFTRGTLVAGHGLLTAEVPRGDCHWDECVADCSCAFACNHLCRFNTVNDYRNESIPLEVNGVRVCGATRQFGLAQNGEPGYAIDGRLSVPHPMPWFLPLPADATVHVFMSAGQFFQGTGKSFFWQVDLGAMATISHVAYYWTRSFRDAFFQDDAITGGFGRGAQIIVSPNDEWNFEKPAFVGYICGHTDDLNAHPERIDCAGAVGQYVSWAAHPHLSKSAFGTNYLSFAEIEVWGSFGCVPCPRGTFAATDGSARCEACPAGQFSTEGASECTTCIAGTVIADGECVDCAPGKYDDDLSSSTPCAKCPGGRFLATSGQAGLDANVICAVCEAGSFSLAGSTSCELCEAGKYDSDGDPSTLCQRCPAGKFGAQEGSTACITCTNPGEYSSEGSTECAVCRPGTYDHDLLADSRCIDCPAGQIAPDAGASICTPCDTGQIAQDGVRCGCPDGTSPGLPEPEFAHCLLAPVAGGHISSRCVEGLSSSCASCGAGTQGWSFARLQLSQYGKTANYDDALEAHRTGDTDAATALAILENFYSTGWSSPADPPIKSSKSCQDLCDENHVHQWRRDWCVPEKAGSANVCSEGDFPIPLDDPSSSDGACLSSSDAESTETSWSYALRVCNTQGARLCTVAELMMQEACQSGCDDRRYAWSSTECEDGHVAAVPCPRGDLCPGECGRETTPFMGDMLVMCQCSPVCQSDNDIFGPDGSLNLAIKCCADVDPLATETSPTATTLFQDACVACPAGWVNAGGSAPCIPCPANTYPNSEASACIPCPDGLLTPAGAASPSDCSTSIRYLGLYYDRESFSDVRDLRSKQFRMGENASPDICRQLCIGYDYMGLQFVDLCFCGNSYNLHGRLADGIEVVYTPIASREGFEGEATASVYLDEAARLDDIGLQIGWDPGEAFDGDALSAWDGCCEMENDQWLQFEFNKLTKVGAYYVNTMAGECPAGWYVKTSTDGEELKTIDYREVDQCYNHDPQLYILPVSALARRFRFVFTGIVEGNGQGNSNSPRLPYGPGIRIRDIQFAIAAPHRNMCGSNHPDAADCVMTNAVYELPNVKCADVTCDVGWSKKAGADDLTLLEDRTDLHASCCDATCATWEANAIGQSCSAYTPLDDSTCGNMYGSVRTGCIYTAPVPDYSADALCVGDNDGTAVPADCDGENTDCDYADGQANEQCDTIAAYFETTCTYTPAVSASPCELSSDGLACAVDGVVGENGYDCVYSEAVILGSEIPESCLPDECPHGSSYISHNADATPVGNNPQKTCCAAPTCEPGNWRNGERCEMCSAGSISSQPDASECTPCSDGTFAPAGSTQCSACGLGQFDDDGLASTPCVQCPSGRFSDTTGARTCAGECQPGTHSMPGSQHLEECVACPTGRVDSDQDASTPCTLCPADTFSDVSGSTSCNLCPDQLTSTGGSSACVPRQLTDVEANCPISWAACIQSDDCKDILSKIIATPVWPQLLAPEVTAVLNCLEEKLAAGDFLAEGCVDSLASNYNPSAIVSDSSCEYDCLTLTRDRQEGAHCFVYTGNTWVDDLTVLESAVFVGQQLQVGISAPSQCYLDLFDDPKPWEQAEQQCVENGGHLASVGDALSNERLATIVSERPGAWIGMNDRAREAGCRGDDFVWSDNSNNNYANFVGGNPDSIGCETVTGCEGDCQAVSGGVGEDCVNLFNGERWNDMQCSSIGPYACGFLCNATGFYSCYLEYHSDVKTWHAAEQACVDRGGHLASFHTEEDTQNLQDLLRRIGVWSSMPMVW